MAMPDLTGRKEKQGRKKKKGTKIGENIRARGQRTVRKTQ